MLCESYSILYWFFFYGKMPHNDCNTFSRAAVDIHYVIAEVPLGGLYVADIQTLTINLIQFNLNLIY